MNKSPWEDSLTFLEENGYPDIREEYEDSHVRKGRTRVQFSPGKKPKKKGIKAMVQTRRRIARKSKRRNKR